MKVYDPAVAIVSATAHPAAVADAPQQTRRRRAPSQAEQQRRKAWGREYGDTMSQIKRDRERSIT